MRLRDKSQIFRLEKYLNNIIIGHTLEEWVNHNIFDLIRRSGLNRPPILLDKKSKLLKSRKIKDIKYTNEIEVQERIFPVNDGFIIEIPKKERRNLLWGRIYLAHEIAHTYFFDINSSPPQSLVYLENGNPDFEWLCFYFGRCLLVPPDWLKEQLSLYPKFDSPEFSLETLFKLSKTFLVPWRIMAQRLIEDLAFWNSIMFQITFYDDLDSLENIKEKRVILNWSTVSGKIKKFSLPIGRKIKGKMVFPELEGKMATFFRDCIKKRQPKFFKMRISSDFFLDERLSKLSSFLGKLYYGQKFQVFFAINNPFDHDNLLFKEYTPKPKFKPNMIICIPLK